jgi:eukaryotic-like serine/threonine-protein kinase
MNDERTLPLQEDRLQEIFLSYVEAAEAGTVADRQTLLAAHPEFAKEIDEFLSDYHHLHRMAAPLRQTDATHTKSAVIRAALHSPVSVRQGNGTQMAGVTFTGLGQLGDYRLLREIGRGGMGIVYEAEQISLRRRVALKILPFAGGADSRQLQRFRNEAEAAAHLHHSHIVPVFAVGAERAVHFYAMQYIEGQSLASLIDDLAEGTKTKAELPFGQPTNSAAAKSTSVIMAISTEHSARSHYFFRRVATIGKQTAEALEYAHQMGVIHRDIKPANLLFDDRGEVWITDFGLAQFQSQTGLTITGELVGTLRYVSPEQALAKKGLVDHRTDIYSLGATLYELLTLQPVFDGKDRHALMQQIAYDDPKPPRMIDPSIPIELETIISKALAKSSTDRYSSAQELADDLQRFLEDQPIQARRPSLVDRGRKWMRRHPSVVIAATMLLICGLIGFAVSTFVIAREQARTQQAYDDLDKQEKHLQAAYAKLAIEEKQTKDAYEKLAVEEKRTKAANLELAAEQARTKLAYQAEEKQRRTAEWDFAQAQKALGLVVQFSEGELAHHPNPMQQDIRRRLLLTVLDYYEDFLAEHADDPNVQAGRERVAQLVTELSSLRGSALVQIVREANVQRDLQLTNEQVKSFADFINKQPNPKDKGLRPMDSTAEVEKAIYNTLDTVQKERFHEIVLQVQNQGRYGFSDPKLVEVLKLTTAQRERMRKIQNETHQAWADHLFMQRRIKKPAEFWTSSQERILQILEPGQRQQWSQMIGRPIAVDFREGYPFDGKNVDVQPRQPPFEFPEWRGAISVLFWGKDHTGSGFGHKVCVDDKQYYAWKGKEIAPTAFEIAVTAGPLTKEERAALMTKGEPFPGATPPSSDPKCWTILFRSDDPSVWNTDSPDPAKYAIPVTQAPKDLRYLRLKRMDTGEIQVISVRYPDLAQMPRQMPDNQNFVWNGAAFESFGGRHLGIAETRPLRGSYRKGPQK